MLEPRDFPRSEIMCKDGCYLAERTGECLVLCQHRRWEIVDARSERDADA